MLNNEMCYFLIIRKINKCYWRVEMKIDVAKEQAEEFGRYLFKIRYWPNWKPDLGQGIGSVALLPSISNPWGISRNLETPDLGAHIQLFLSLIISALCLQWTDLELPLTETLFPVLWHVRFLWLVIISYIFWDSQTGHFFSPWSPPHPPPAKHTHPVQIKISK